ncbi:MAG: alpha-amylase [Flavisolibacter sp.]
MQNGTMIQYFHWYFSKDEALWKRVFQEAKNIARMGITAIWLPPACKSTRGAYSTGYDVYDFYDLGEFDQKGNIETKYGNKQQYLKAIKELKACGVQVYVDIVLNHMGGGDETELIKVIKVDPENRNKKLGEPFDIEAFTKFTFPGRKGKYSQFVWNYTCFSGVDYDHKTGQTAIYDIINDYGDDWEQMVTDEKGNYDYLMFNDIEFRNPAVREELKRWGEWYYDQTGFDGMRLDAVKHISPKFYNEWLGHMRAVTGKNLFAVGEYWAPGNLPLLLKYIEATEGKMSIFDASLHHSFHLASQSRNNFDLTTILKDSLVSVDPTLAVTVVDNHDTQPLQSLEAPVEPWFKPLAYALILLRQEGYPCIFYPDLYGAEYTDKGRDGKDYHIVLMGVEKLPEMIKIRNHYAYGPQRDYFDHANCIGWIREGIEEKEKSGCAVVLSNGDKGNKNMEMGLQHKGKTFKDALGKCSERVKINEKGWGEFYCAPGSVSVWLLEEASIDG